MAFRRQINLAEQRQGDQRSDIGIVSFILKDGGEADFEAVMSPNMLFRNLTAVLSDRVMRAVDFAVHILFQLQPRCIWFSIHYATLRLASGRLMWERDRD